MDQATLAGLFASAIPDNTGGGGGGTVTSFSFTNANGVNGVVTNPTTTPNLTVSLSNITPTTVTTTSYINEAKWTDIPSATTTDLGAANGNYGNVTGTTPITGLGTVQAGTERIATFTGILTLTNNVTSLILPTGANITTAVGDTAGFRSLGSGNWKCIWYMRADGTALAGGSTTTFADNAFRVYNSSDNTKLLAFDVSSVATGTTRTLTVPNAAGLTIAGLPSASIIDSRIPIVNGTTGALTTNPQLTYVAGITLLNQVTAVGTAIQGVQSNTSSGSNSFWGSMSGLNAAGDVFFGYFGSSGATGNFFRGNLAGADKLLMTSKGGIIIQDVLNEAKWTDIPSATITDLGVANGNYGNVTGTTTITGLGTVQAGTERIATFTGILTLTNNATSLILPTGANITTAVGDTAGFRSLGSGNWKCIWYMRASGAALVGGLPTGTNKQTLVNVSGTWTATSNNLFDNTTGLITTTTGVSSSNTKKILSSTDTAGGTEGFAIIGGVNTFIGNTAGNTSVTSTGHVAVGYLAGSALTNTGNGNTFIGQSAGRNQTTGSSNTAVGSGALSQQTLFNENTAIGAVAGQNTTGGANTFVGYNAGGGILSSGFNIVIGYHSGNSQAWNTGTNAANVLIGNYTQLASITDTNKLIIHSGTGSTTSPLIYGDFSNRTLAINGILSTGDGSSNPRAFNESKGADIASASTTDIGAATGNYVNVTGTTTITGLGTVQAGTERIATFTGILTLTHNATSLILPTGANITTAVGDTAGFRSLGSGNWKCVWYMRASGAALSGGGLTNWTESTGTVTTAYVAFSPNNAAANVHAVLAQKGTGGVMAQIPTASSAGGNNRGSQAVDWQSSRTSATQVASGNTSVIGGGLKNTASGTSSTVAGGDSNTASNSGATVGGGNGNLASQTYATIAGGQTNNATGSNSTVGGGNTNTALGQFSTIPGGENNNATGTLSFAIGNQATASRYGEFAQSNGAFSNVNPCQKSSAIWWGQTSNATPTELFLDNSSARWTLSPKEAQSLEIIVNLMKSDGSAAGMMVRLVAIRQGGAGVSATTLVGSVQTIGTDQLDAALSTATIALTADTTNGSLKVSVTGVAATTIYWNVTATIASIYAQI